MSISVSDFMSTPVVTCTIDADVGKVRDLMKLKKFSALPVVHVKDDEVTVRGIVTYRDIAGVYDDNVSIKQVMTDRVEVISSYSTAKEAARIMTDRGIHHLVVLSGGKISGMISSADLVRLVAYHEWN